MITYGSRIVLMLIVYAAIRTSAMGMWWNLGMQGVKLLQNPDIILLNPDSVCSQLRGLTSNQISYCNSHGDHMTPVSRGANLGIHECQWQFRFRRWNCSTVEDTSVFGPVINIGSRETAFVNAISAAGVVYSIARACRRGEITSCACSGNRKHGGGARRPKGLIGLWDPCGDDVAYGLQTAEEFVDAREMEKNHPRKSVELARTIMNLHNNEAGRRAAKKANKVACKCHGVSGSCSLKTCWYQMVSFREVGDRLKERYDAATQVTFNKQGTRLRRLNRRFNKPSKYDLIYIDDSPDYCVADREIGSAGTSGRYCNKNSQGTDGCELMCCGRGYNSFNKKITQRCNCKFHWCCYVQCDDCEQIVEVHVCR